MVDVSFTGQSGSSWQYGTDERLGEGSFGVVYAGVSADGTSVAIKVLEKKRLFGVIGDRLLRREVEIGRQVIDGGGDMLLPVIDVGEPDGKLLLVMPRAEKALAEVVMPIDESEIRAVLVDITSGLQQLHTFGIIHRDLKPANVLRHRDRWKLADFGIARNQEIGTQDLTFSGWGSYQYMAPEIWELKSPTVKTDLYALGCLAYELLTGCPPYPGNREVARAGHLTSPSPEVPASNIILKRLIGSLIAKQPGSRPQDAREVLERLRTAPSYLSPALERIAIALDNRAVKRNRSDARAAASAVEAERLHQLATQAHRVLLEIAHDAIMSLRALESSATLHEGMAPATPIDRARAMQKALAQFTDVNDRENVIDSDPSEASSIFLNVDIKKIRIDFRGLSGSVVTFIRAVPRGGTFIMGGFETHGICELQYDKVGNRFEWRAYRNRTGPVSRYHGDSDRPPGLSKDAVPFTVELLLEIVADTLNTQD